MVFVFTLALQTFSTALAFAPLDCAQPQVFNSAEAFSEEQMGAKLSELPPSLQKFLQAQVSAGSVQFTEFVQDSCQRHRAAFAEGDQFELWLRGSGGFQQSQDEVLELDEFLMAYGRWFKTQLLSSMQEQPQLQQQLSIGRWAVISDEFSEQVNLLGIDQDPMSAERAWAQFAYRWDSYPNAEVQAGALLILRKHGVLPIFVSQNKVQITYHIHEVTRAWTGVEHAERFYIQTHLPVILTSQGLSYGLPRDQETFILASPQAFPDTQGFKAKLQTRLQKTCAVLTPVRANNWQNQIKGIIAELSERFLVDPPQVGIEQSLPGGETAGLKDQTLHFASATIAQRLAELPSHLQTPWLIYLITQEFTHYLQQNLTEAYEMNLRMYNSPTRAYQLGGLTGHQTWYQNQPLEADAQSLATTLARSCTTKPGAVVELR